MTEDEVAYMGGPGGDASRSIGGCFTLAQKGGVTGCPDLSRACEDGACLPKGGLFSSMNSFSNFEGLMAWAWDVLKDCRLKLRRQWTMAKGISAPSSSDDIFPLAASQVWPVAVRSVISALNDLAGCAPAHGCVDQPDSPPVVQKDLMRLVESFDVWNAPCPEISFQQLFSSKTVDYVGEEVKVAQRLSWAAVSPSLPDGVGLLPLQDFCTLGTLHYVENFTDYLLPGDAIRVPKPPSVMVVQEFHCSMAFLQLVRGSMWALWKLRD